MNKNGFIFKVLVSLVVLGSLSLQPAKASYWENPVCQGVADFAGGAEGFAVASGVGAKGVVAAGLIATGIGLGGEASSIYDRCDATMEDYADYWVDRGVMEYDDYLRDFCNGDPLGCSDPNLSPHCGPFSMHCSAPHDPRECTFYTNCLPQMTAFGSSTHGVSISDLISAIYFIENGFLTGSWDPGFGEQIGSPSVP